MSRLIDRDFQRLVEFTKNYRIEDVSSSGQKVQLIKRAHRHCLAAIQCFAAIEQISSKGNIIFGPQALERTDIGYHSLAESFSDLSASFYSALHGLNKSAHMTLRSAIETHIRSLAGIYSEEAKTSTSVYRLFEIAKDCTVFENHAQEFFTSLRSEYSSLCAHTHSASKLHMIKNHAMSNFPRIDLDKLKNWVTSYERSIKSILSILIVNNPQIYLITSPLARDVYDEILPTRVKVRTLGGPASQISK